MGGVGIIYSLYVGKPAIRKMEMFFFIKDKSYLIERKSVS